MHHADNRSIWLNLRDRFPHPYTLEDATRWVMSASTQSPFTNLAIEVDGDAVGGIGINPNQDIERISAEIGYWLGEEFWGRGICTAAVQAMTGYAFGELDLLRLYALPFTTNAASIRVLEKAGYEREGLLRQSAIKDGAVKDQVLYARLRE